MSLEGGKSRCLLSAQSVGVSVCMIKALNATRISQKVQQAPPSPATLLRGSSSSLPPAYGSPSGQTPNQVGWPNHAPSSVLHSTAFPRNGPIFSVPSELWLQIIGNLDMPSLELLFSALYFIFRPLGILPPASSHLPVRPLPQIGPWLGNSRTLYDVMTRHPYEIVDHIFQQLTPQEKVNVVLALHSCNQR